MRKLVDLSFNDFDRESAEPLLQAMATTARSSREKKVFNLHINLAGNEGCEDLFPPHLARSKQRWDFVGSTRPNRLATNPHPYQTHEALYDPLIRAAMR